MAKRIWDEKPDEKDPKYSFGEHPSTGLPKFNSVYFLTDMHSWLEKLKVEHDLLKEHSGRWLHFVAVDYPEIKKWISPQKIMELIEKAERWDQYAIYDNEKDSEIPVKDLIVAYERLEAVMAWYNKNKPDLYALLTTRALSEICKILEA